MDLFGMSYQFLITVTLITVNYFSGGNCLTAMIATISMEPENLGESISTCRFSQRVARIANNARWPYVVCFFMSRSTVVCKCICKTLYIAECNLQIKVLSTHFHVYYLPQSNPSLFSSLFVSSLEDWALILKLFAPWTGLVSISRLSSGLVFKYHLHRDCCSSLFLQQLWDVQDWY